MIIFLTGMMGSGKSAAGRRLASRLNCPFIDLDDEIVQIAGKSIPEIFSEDGEDAFRQMEADLPRQIQLPETAVIATGGGFPLNEKNRKWMDDNGRVVWLQAEPETLVQRIGVDEGRPLIRSGEKEEKLREILTERTFVYKTANCYIRTDGKKISEIVNIILNRISNAQDPS